MRRRGGPQPSSRGACRAAARRVYGDHPMVALTQSYWPADTSEPIVESTVGDLLRAAAAAVPNRVALVDGRRAGAGRRSWTYAALLQQAEEVARALLGRFAPGERIAVWAPNIPEWQLLRY